MARKPWIVCVAIFLTSAECRSVAAGCLDDGPQQAWSSDLGDISYRILILSCRAAAFGAETVISACFGFSGTECLSPTEDCRPLIADQGVPLEVVPKGGSLKVNSADRPLQGADQALG